MPTRAYNPGDYDYFGDWGSPEPREGPGSSAEKQEELIHIFTQDFEVVTIGPQRAQVGEPSRRPFWRSRVASRVF